VVIRRKAAAGTLKAGAVLPKEPAGTQQISEEDVKLAIKKHVGYDDRLTVAADGSMVAGWDHRFHPGGHLPAAAARLLFDQDYEVAITHLYLWRDKLAIPEPDPARRAALLDLAFSLGLSGLLGMPAFGDAVKAGDWEHAAKLLLNTEWSYQAGRRALELAAVLRNGRMQSPRVPRNDYGGQNAESLVREPYP
jgi:lysozyme